MAAAVISTPSKPRALLFLSVLLAGVLLASCAKQLPTYRYKITVVVATPEGRRVGYSVIEVRSRITPRLTPESGGVHIHQIGEATIIPLCRGRYLFATLRWRDGVAEMMSETFADQLANERAALRLKGNDQTTADLIGAISRVRGARQLPRSEVPVLAYFSDRSDPTTVQAVTPEALGSVFGRGYRVVAISVEITDEPITANIQPLLPWLQRGRYAAVDTRAYGKNVSDLTEAQHLEHADFAAGYVGE